MQTSIILVNPQMGENIGATARVMLNFGLRDLRIVSPRDGWPNPKALEMAKGAGEVIENATIFRTCEEAVADIHLLYATTARPRDMVKDVVTPRQCALNIKEGLAEGKNCAIMFGPEKSGLSNNDLTLADALTFIPVSDIYPSLNLAQAVAVLCYEVFAAGSPAVKNSPEPSATKGEIDNMLKRLEERLDGAGFFKTEGIKPTMARNIRNMFVKAQLTGQEVQTMNGIISSLGRKAGEY